jgi:hypothetical protein
VNNQLSQSFCATCEHKIWLQNFYLRRRFVLGEWVCHVGDARAEIHQELALSHAILQPTPSHIHGLGSLLLDGVICETFSSGIVYLHGGRWLIVAQFAQCNDDGDRCLAVEISRSNL